MKVEERQQLAKRVVHFYTEIANRNKFETVSHFVREGFKKRGIYAIIYRYEKNGSAQFKPKSGRKIKVATPETVEKVRKKLENTNNSIRDTAKELGISKTRCQDIKKSLGIKSNKCQKVPKHTDDQQKRAKTNCRKIYRKSINKVLILDDETYVKKDPIANYGQRFFHYSDKSKVPEKNRFTGTEKFGQKYLIWQAIDEFGNVCEPYISTGIMTSEEYKSECIEKRLLPFIDRYHKNKDLLLGLCKTCIYFC
jgi:transposase